jgi:hypothetical protein
LDQSRDLALDAPIIELDDGSAEHALEQHSPREICRWHMLVVSFYVLYRSVPQGCNRNCCKS